MSVLPKKRSLTKKKKKRRGDSECYEPYSQIWFTQWLGGRTPQHS